MNPYPLSKNQMHVYVCTHVYKYKYIYIHIWTINNENYISNHNLYVIYKVLSITETFLLQAHFFAIWRASSSPPALAAARLAEDWGVSMVVPQ